MRSLLAAALLATAAACYPADPAPKDASSPPGPDASHNAGMACDRLDDSLCEGARLMMWCDLAASGHKTWVQIFCRGPSGCAPGADGGAVCDFNRAMEGDACPRALEGQAVCYATDAGFKQALQCFDGYMVVHHCVVDCVSFDAGVSCPAM
jgi:hypothetical protein